MKTNTSLRKVVLATSIAAALAAPTLANADSAFVTGATPSATAHLDFQIVIPRVLYLRIGTGTNLANNGTIDQIQFSVPAANVGDSTVISGTGGDLTGGVVTARLIGNNGTIAFSSQTAGALGNGSGDTISYAQIATATATLTSPTALPAPALADGATTSINVAPVAGKVVNRDAKWTFTYANTTVAAPGTYGGVNTNNSRVTYTASMP